MATEVSAINWIYVLKIRSEKHLYHWSEEDEHIIDAIVAGTDFEKEDIELIKVDGHSEFRNRYEG